MIKSILLQYVRKRTKKEKSTELKNENSGELDYKSSLSNYFCGQNVTNT